MSFALVAAILCVSVFTTDAGIPRFFRGRPRGGMVGSPKPRSNGLYGNAPAPDMWVKQRLDHFNDADTRTWQQVLHHQFL